MGKKDRQSMEELWSKRFDEETEINEEEPLSRKAKREREKGISPILTAFLIFMLLLAILPTSAYLWWSSRESMSEEPTSPSVEQVAENSQDEEIEESEDAVPEDSEESDDEETDNRVSEEEESQDETEDVTEADEGSSEERSETLTESAGASETSSDESGSETEVTDSSQEEVSSSDSTDTESSVDSAPATEEETESSENGSYYTVQAGDNMYRIALNHGMSTEELMQLNGIQDETVYVGQELRVN